MKARQAYIVIVENLSHPEDKHFYLCDESSIAYVKKASSLDELRIFADLNGYEVVDFKRLMADKTA